MLKIFFKTKIYIFIIQWLEIQKLIALTSIFASAFHKSEPLISAILQKLWKFLYLHKVFAWQVKETKISKRSKLISSLSEQMQNCPSVTYSSWIVQIKHSSNKHLQKLKLLNSKKFLFYIDVYIF